MRIDLAVGAGIEAEAGVADRLVDRRDQALVPDLTVIIRGSGTLTVPTWLSGMRWP